MSGQLERGSFRMKESKVGNNREEYLVQDDRLQLTQEEKAIVAEHVKNDKRSYDYDPRDFKKE